MNWEMVVYGTETDIYHIVQWFFIYSILGWCLETTYMSFCARKFVNRGFIFGPICPIYGFGALGAYFLLRRFAGNYILLYFAGSLMATLFEFIVAKLMIYTLGEFWWDYREKPFNYEGIICLESSIAWGFYTIGLFAFLERGVRWISDSYAREVGCIAAGILMVYYMVDFTVHLCKAKAVEIPVGIRVLPGKVRNITDNIRNFYH